MNTWLDGMNCAAGICHDNIIGVKEAMEDMSIDCQNEARSVIIGIMDVHTDILRAIIKEQDAVK